MRSTAARWSSGYVAREAAGKEVCVAEDRRERRAQFMTDVRQELVLQPRRFLARAEAAAELIVLRLQAGHLPALGLHLRDATARGCQLIRDEDQEVALAVIEIAGGGEVERERAIDPRSHPQRQGDERDEAELPRRLPPLPQGDVREHVADLDEFALCHGPPRGTPPDPDAELAQEPRRCLGPGVGTGKLQQGRVRGVPLEDRTEPRTHERGEAAEGEPVHLEWGGGGQERMGNLAGDIDFPVEGAS
jgi:hypothetical protein